jgi:hypothetical protein
MTRTSLVEEEGAEVESEAGDWTTSSWTASSAPFEQEMAGLELEEYFNWNPRGGREQAGIFRGAKIWKLGEEESESLKAMSKKSTANSWLTWGGKEGMKKGSYVWWL